MAFSSLAANGSFEEEEGGRNDPLACVECGATEGDFYRKSPGDSLCGACLDRMNDAISVEEDRKIAVAMCLFLMDRINDHDEFFDTDGREYVVGESEIDMKGNGWIFIGDQRFKVAITAEDE